MEEEEKKKKKKKKNIMCMLFLLIILLMSEANEIEDDGFMKVDRDQFMLKGNPFYGNGFNAYWLMYVASDPSQRFKISLAFQEASNHSLLIARTWAFRDAGYSPLQYSPGSYNEHMFQGLDFVIEEARKHNIKLILSLVNNYNDSGGKQQYVEWARARNEDDFFTNSLVKGYYKNHVKAVLTRKNSFSKSGMLYKDDPTIMAWELMNEPRCPSDPSGDSLHSWIQEMASYLKSIDSNHLLEAGLEGFYGPSRNKVKHNPHHFQLGTDFLRNNQIPQIDFATLHSYPDQWLTGESNEAQLLFLDQWLNNHIKDAQTIIQKPLLLSEFGKSSKDSKYETEERDQLMATVYEAIYSSARRGGAAAGGLFWQLLIEGMDNLKDGYEIVLSQSPSTATLIQQESEKLNQIRILYKDHHIFSNGSSITTCLLLLDLLLNLLIAVISELI